MKPLLSLPVNFAQVNLAEWRKERAKKSLYELQIEACQEAVRALAKVKGLSKEEGAKAREKIEAEVAKLRRTKRPHLPKFSFYETTYDAEVAKRVRKAVQSGSREHIQIIR